MTTTATKQRATIYTFITPRACPAPIGYKSEHRHSVWHGNKHGELLFFCYFGLGRTSQLSFEKAFTLNLFEKALSFGGFPFMK